VTFRFHPESGTSVTQEASIVKITLVRTLAVSLGGALLAVSASGCASSQAANGKEVTTLRYLSAPGLLNYAELADALGYLKGLKLKTVGVAQGGPASLQALVTGQSDFAVGPFNGATAKVASTGIKLKAVAAAYGSGDKINSSLLTLDSSSIRNGRDLIGKKVAVNTLGANAEAVLDTYLKKEGLTPKEIDKVTLVPLPGINTEPALRKHQVDAAYLGFAAKLLAIKHGGIRKLATDTDFVGPYNGGSYVLKDAFIKDNPKTTRTLVGGITKAIVWDQAHKPAETVAVIGKWLTAHGRAADLKALGLWQGNGVATPGGVLRDKDFSLWIDWLKSSGEVKAASLKPGDLYTNAFNIDEKGQ
jgi:ABC-type nitrate/sulfonate/bicarbonate transport system substrate-binding protein